MTLPLRVVKVGGSLLDNPLLTDNLRAWLARQTPAHHVLVTGGGILVDEVRNWYSRWPLTEETAHWICVELMSVTARLLHSRLPEFVLLGDDSTLVQRLGSRDCTIFDPVDWLRKSEPRLPGTRLRTTWDVTSDSIAGRLAVVLRASEFVLLKSALPADFSPKGIAALSDSGFVDAMLKELATELPPARIVNLGSDGQEELTFGSLEPPAVDL